VTTVYHRADLLGALLASRRYHDAVPELRDYHVPRYAAMAIAFGLLGDECPDPLLPPTARDRFPLAETAYTDRAMYGLFENAVEAYERLHSPFSGYLAAPQEIRAMYKEHGVNIEAAYDVTRTRIRALLDEVLGIVWRIDADRTVTDDDLRRCGFDPTTPVPDPHAFW
jgi:hypothetical protein